MKISDRQIVDSVMRLTLSTSCYIEKLLEEEIEMLCREGYVNVARLSNLDRARRQAADIANGMRFLITI